MYLVFDFDGTIVNSFECIIEKFNTIADQLNFHKISVQEAKELRNLSAWGIIQFLQIPVYKIPRILYQLRKGLYHEMKNLTPVKDLPEVLQNLYDEGFPLGILTSNSTENVNIWLKHNKMEHLFNFINTEPRHWSKKYLLNKTLKNYQIEKKTAYYIGDETRDIDAAKYCGVNSIAVTWGFSSEKILSQSAPHHILRTPAELLHLIQNKKLKL